MWVRQQQEWEEQQGDMGCDVSTRKDMLEAEATLYYMESDIWRKQMWFS